MAQTNFTLQTYFEFPEPFNNYTAPVENWLELTESFAGISLTTLLNLGIWWGVCKTPGIISGLSNEHRLNDEGRERVDILKADFCLPLASIITTAEVALISRSPKPLEQNCWDPVLFVVAGSSVSAVYLYPKRRPMEAASFALFWLAFKAGSKIVASTATASIPGEKHARDIEIERRYVYKGNIIPPMVNGVLAGLLTYQAMIYKNFEPEDAATFSAVSATLAGALSGMGIISKTDRKVGVAAAGAAAAGAGAGAGTVMAAAAAGAGTGTTIAVTAVALADILAETRADAAVSTGAIVENVVSTGAIMGAGFIAGIVFIAKVGTETIAAARAEIFAAGRTEAEAMYYKVMVKNKLITCGALVITLRAIKPIIEADADGDAVATLKAGIATAWGASILLTILSKKASDNPLITASVTWAFALLFTVANGFSNHAAYGYPLEESLSEAAWNQWKKFYAPQEYFSILFN